MKKINIILIILLSCLSIDSYSQKKDPDISNNSISFNNLLVQQSALCIKKHALIIALTPIIIYHHTNITNFITGWPYISSISFYLFLNYMCDFILNYQQQQSLLNIITLLKKITLYLVISHGIKNHIYQKKLSIESLLYIHDEFFLDSITNKLPYSFNEITVLALKSYQELKIAIKSLNAELKIESEEFVFLCHASSINIQSLLYLVQNEPVLYQMIDNFEQNPQKNLAPLVEYLTSEITQNFMKLEQKLLVSNMQNYTT